MLCYRTWRAGTVFAAAASTAAPISTPRSATLRSSPLEAVRLVTQSLGSSCSAVAIDGGQSQNVDGLHTLVRTDDGQAIRRSRPSAVEQLLSENSSLHEVSG